MNITVLKNKAIGAKHFGFAECRFGQREHTMSLLASRYRGVVWLQTSEQQRLGDENVPRWYSQLRKRVLSADLVEFVLVCAVVTKPLTPAFRTPSNLVLGVLEEYSDADQTVTGIDPGHREIK